MSDRQEEWKQTEVKVPRPDPMLGAQRSAELLSIESNRSFEDRDYYEMRITAVDEKNVMRVEGLARELAIRMSAADTAILKAEAAVNERLLKMNEFREQLTEQAATFATRNSMDALDATVMAKIESVQATFIAENKGLRDTLLAKIAGVEEASLVRYETGRREREAEMKNVWKFIYGLATAIAVIQTILEFSPR